MSLSDQATLKFDDPAPRLSASQRAASDRSDFQFERPDWTLFRSVDTLAQKAGVRKDLLRPLVLKELTDNALDSGAIEVKVSALSEDCFIVLDNGRGIPGGREAIARLFSLNRPLLSSKLWRVPSRGAMGNGLRVVVGAVAASDGSLVVETGGTRYDLRPRDDGSTAVLSETPSRVTTGTAILIAFGAAIPKYRYSAVWAHQAIRMAGVGTAYSGKPSPWWYDADAWFAFLRGTDRPVRELIEQLDGCTGAKAGRIAAAFRGVPANALSRDQAVELLQGAREHAKPVRPERLGAVGAREEYHSYAVERGILAVGGREPRAEIPFVVEVWANAHPRNGADSVAIDVYVNRTPTVARVNAWRFDKKFQISGCGLQCSFDAPPGRYSLTMNLTVPWCPITTDGKEPDLSPFVQMIVPAIQKAARRAKSTIPPQMDSISQKDIFLSNLQQGIAKASGDGVYRFNQRQLFYVLRPVVIDATGKEPSWENFCKIITDHEAEKGDIPGMYRDPRGTLYHPHTGEDISLGTLAVEEYSRPAWTFSQILYIEKEGFFEALKAARWPERHDCALLTSKGYSTRAVRDLLDLLGDGEEPITVFCIHDADAFGTMIYQTMQEATRARARRRVEIVNLGLEPWEALVMDLKPESLKEAERGKAVADYVSSRPDGAHWRTWLQTNRVELNEMTTPQLIAWLDGKMEEHSAGKVMPPGDVVGEAAKEQLATRVRAIITERILREAKVNEQVDAAVGRLSLPDPEAILDQVEEWLENQPTDSWRAPVKWIAEAATAALATQDDGGGPTA